MIPELENPPHPLDDIDDGYGDEEDIGELGNEPLNFDKITRALAVLRGTQKRAADELRSGPEGPDDFGEVSDPDDDDASDPDDFFGLGSAGSC